MSVWNSGRSRRCSCDRRHDVEGVGTAVEQALRRDAMTLGRRRHDRIGVGGEYRLGRGVDGALGTLLSIPGRGRSLQRSGIVGLDQRGADV